MRKLIGSVFGLLAWAVAISIAPPPAAAGGSPPVRGASAPARAADSSPEHVMTLTWEQLLPTEERGHYDPTPPPPIHGYLGEGAPAALQTGSYHVNPKLDGAWVRIPGFIVPLEMSANGTAREFLLVPYFGACIHVPPPPPNQIVYVTMVSGRGPTSMSNAEWVYGRLTAKVQRSALASAAYTLAADRIEPYQYTMP
jgi:hypothetical protein